MRRRTAVIAALAAGTVIVPLPVWAYWSQNSNTSGATQAGALAAPSITVAMSGSAARITVTAAPSTGITPTSYRVDRTAPGATVTGVCTIGASTGFCQDASPVPSVVNTYKVVGVYGTWSAIGANAPTANITPPAVNTAFTVSAPATATAGTSFPVTITATATAANTTDTTYSGLHTFTLTGAANSPSGAVPTLPTSATFVNGVATVNVTLVKAGSTSLTVTDNGRTGTSAAITVGSGAPSALKWGTVTAPVGTVTCTSTSCNGTNLGNDGSVSGQLTLADAYGNPATNAGSGWTVVFTATQSKAGSGTFTSGSQSGASITVTVPPTGTGAIAFSYAHNGNADWQDNLTITMSKTGVPGSTSTVTATLNKTT